jgi:ribosomal protein S13
MKTYRAMGIVAYRRRSDSASEKSGDTPSLRAALEMSVRGQQRRRQARRRRLAKPSVFPVLGSS